MTINKVQQIKSSFLSIDKDYAIIIDKMLNNNRLKKLLFYSTPDCLEKPNLTQEESLGLLNKQIKLVPKIYIDHELMSYIIIKTTSFFESSNPEFRNSMLYFDIICHYNNYLLRDFQMRPYRIAAELDTMFNRSRLTGIGRVNFNGGISFNISDEYCGFQLGYAVVHGEEDKKAPLNPEDEAILQEQ